MRITLKASTQLAHYRGLGDPESELAREALGGKAQIEEEFPDYSADDEEAEVGARSSGAPE